MRISDDFVLNAYFDESGDQTLSSGEFRTQ